MKRNFFKVLDKRAGEILLKSAYKKFEASCLFLAAEAIEKAIEPKDRMFFLRKLGGGSLRDLSAELQKVDIQKKRGNVGALVEWAGKKKKFKTVVEHLKGKPGIRSPERLTGYLKAEARKKGITCKSQAITNVRKVIDGMGNVEKGVLSLARKYPGWAALGVGTLALGHVEAQRKKKLRRIESAKIRELVGKKPIVGRKK